MHPAAPTRVARRIPVGILRATGSVVAALLLLGSVPADAADLETSRQRREEVRQDRAAVAADLEVLGADKAAVVAALDALRADLVAEEAALVDATEEAEEARVAAAYATVAAERMDHRLDTLQGLLSDLAVGAFIGDSGSIGDLAMFVSSSDVGNAAKAGLLADLEVERQDAIATELTTVKADLDEAREAADDASAHAVVVRDEVAVRAAAAEEARDTQARFVATVEAELERRLAEAAGLEQLDQQLAADIALGEQELAARLKAEADARAVADALARAADVGGSSRAGDTSSTRATSSPPSGRVVGVGGIQVDSTIAEPLAALLAAAEADGVRLAGGGYRDAAAQLALRGANCGATDYGRYERPASECSPPTARPGHSMHEQGLAIDFTYEGGVIGTRNSPAYRWLAANAARFGFFNLPSEPWHWSVNGS